MSVRALCNFIVYRPRRWLRLALRGGSFGARFHMRFAVFVRSGFGWRALSLRGAPLRLRLAWRAAAQGLAAVNTVFRVLRLSRCWVGFRVAVGVPVRGASAPFRVDRWHVVVCAFRTSAVSMSLLSVWLHSPSGGCLELARGGGLPSRCCGARSRRYISSMDWAPPAGVLLTRLSLRRRLMGWTSNKARRPAEFKHIIKRRKRN